MPSRKMCIALAGCFLGGVATGYFSRPERVVTKVDVREKIVEVTAKATRNDVVTRSREISRPDGTKIVRVVTVDKSVSRESGKLEATITRTEEKTEERSAPQWNVRAMAGITFGDAAPVYGAGVDRRILGPIFLGAYGFSNGTVGAAIALSF
jgi:hypothetical protein